MNKRVSIETLSFILPDNAVKRSSISFVISPTDYTIFANVHDQKLGEWKVEDTEENCTAAFVYDPEIKFYKVEMFCNNCMRIHLEE